MNQSEKIDKIAPAIVAAQASLEGAKKASLNPHFKNKYADLSQVWSACEDALRQQKLAVIQGLGETLNGAMHMDTMLLHESGQWLSAHSSIPLPKTDPQGYGSATTYLRRYSLAALLGIVQEDDDGNAGSRSNDNNKSNGNGKIDDAQYATLVTLMENKRVTVKRFCGKYQIDKVTDLPARLYDDAIAALNAVEAEAA